MYTRTHIPSDEDFEVTAEMLIHDDVDDESTLDEEEAEEDQDDQEIADLQKVGGYMSLSISLLSLSLPFSSLSLSLSPLSLCSQ